MIRDDQRWSENQRWLEWQYGVDSVDTDLFDTCWAQEESPQRTVPFDRKKWIAEERTICCLIMPYLFICLRLPFSLPFFPRTRTPFLLLSLVSHTVKQDLAKYKSMDTSQVEAALKASTYLAKWVDWVGSNSKLWNFPWHVHSFERGLMFVSQVLLCCRLFVNGSCFKWIAFEYASWKLPQWSAWEPVVP